MINKLDATDMFKKYSKDGIQWNIQIFSKPGKMIHLGRVI